MFVFSLSAISKDGFISRQITENIQELSLTFDPKLRTLDKYTPIW